MKEYIKKQIKKILSTAVAMLIHDKKDYVEVETKKKGNMDIERGMRIRFLDDIEK